MSHSTITVTLDERLAYYEHRHGQLPSTLPVTLDEISWLGEYVACYYALRYSRGRRLIMPTHYQGIRLELVFVLPPAFCALP